MTELRTPHLLLRRARVDDLARLQAVLSGAGGKRLRLQRRNEATDGVF